MANFLELEANSGVIHQREPISFGNAEVEADTTNASKIIQTNSQGKLDSSLLEHDTTIKNLNVSGAFSFWGSEGYDGDWSISSSGNISAYGNRIESYADNTRYDAWDDDWRVCIDFGERQLLPRSAYTYEPSLDWSDENGVKTRVVDDSNGYNWGFFARTDFSTGRNDGMFFDVVNHASGSVATASLDPSTANGCHCYLALGTATSATGAAQARGTAGFQLVPSFCKYEWGARLKVSELSSSTEEYSVQIGIQSSLTSTNGLSTRNHIIFNYDRATYGDHRWRTITRLANNNSSVLDTGISAAISFQGFWIEVIEENSILKVNFWMMVAGEWAFVCQHTTNIPTATALHPRVAILKSVGTTPREIHLDYMCHSMKFLSHQTRV